MNFPLQLTFKPKSNTGQIPYTAKLLSEKTFMVVHKIHYSLENFRSCAQNTLFTGKLLRCIRPWPSVLYTASNSRGKPSRSAEKPQKFCCIWHTVTSLTSYTTFRLLYAASTIDISNGHEQSASQIIRKTKVLIARCSALVIPMGVVLVSKILKEDWLTSLQ